MSQTILVSGASGYIASHVIKLLLERGYKVIGTVRNLANKESINSFMSSTMQKRTLNSEKPT